MAKVFFAIDFPAPKEELWINKSDLILTDDPNFLVQVIEVGLKKLVDDSWDSNVAHIR